MRLWLRLLAGIVLTFCLGLNSLPSSAASAEVKTPTLSQSDEELLLTGYFALTLSPALTDAINHGIPLVFQMESEIKRSRWYWADESVYKARIDRRLTYNALVRNYRVSEDQDGRNFVELADALHYIARPVIWRIPSGQAKPGETLDVAIRFRLDPTFLPKPFQVVSFGDRDWRLDSDWRAFRLTVPAVAGAK